MILGSEEKPQCAEMKQVFWKETRNAVGYCSTAAVDTNWGDNR